MIFPKTSKFVQPIPKPSFNEVAHKKKTDTEIPVLQVHKIMNGGEKKYGGGEQRLRCTYAHTYHERCHGFLRWWGQSRGGRSVVGSQPRGPLQKNNKSKKNVQTGGRNQRRFWVTTLMQYKVQSKYTWPWQYLRVFNSSSMPSTGVSVWQSFCYKGKCVCTPI